MKNKLLIAGILAALAMSCSEDFLNVPPTTFVSSSTFFKTESDFKQAVSGAYASLRGVYSDAYVLGEMRSDNTDYIFKTSDRGPQNLDKEDVAGFIDNANNRYSNNKYYSCYQGISRCNAILDRIDASSISADSKKVLGGEARFLRAFYYFELVQYFGDVPLHLKEVMDLAGSALPRSAKADVYSQIIKDATDAVAQLPTTQSEKGRVTQGSAQMLLGYVYMTLHDYPKAEQALRAVTQLGYSLNANYADNFKTANKNSKESIFEVQYQQGNQGQQSTFTYQFIPALANTSVITGVSGNNQSFGGWNIPSGDLIAAYESGDLRKAASIADGFIDVNGELGTAGNFVNSPYTIKYLNPHTVFNNCDDNWIVYRYADALLLLAECLNEQTKSPEALPFLNQVRTRAGLANTVITDQSALRTIIAKERRVELAFENHRWLDLVRTGEAVNVMNAYGSALKAIHPYLLSRTYQVDQNKLVFPIPQNEIILNPALTQNLGY